MGESMFGIKGKGFAIIASDMHTSYSIIEMKADEDKVGIGWQMKFYHRGGILLRGRRARF